MLLDWKLEISTPENIRQERTGAEVLRLCRALYPLMPVIVITSIPTNTWDVRTDALWAEADGFLEKGFSNILLIAHIRRWLKRVDATPKPFLPEHEEDIKLMKEYRDSCIRHVLKLLDGKIYLTAEKLGLDRGTVSKALKVLPPKDLDLL